MRCAVNLQIHLGKDSVYLLLTSIQVKEKSDAQSILYIPLLEAVGCHSEPGEVIGGQFAPFTNFMTAVY